MQNTEGPQANHLIIPSLPMVIADGRRADTSGITAEGCLNFISSHSATVTFAGFVLLSVGVLYVYSESIWVADVRTRKKKDQLQSALAESFREAQHCNHGAGRSKRYEFARLSFQLAQHKDMKALAAQAAQQGSVGAAAQFLASKFKELAPSVAALARHFGTERSSGKRRAKAPVGKQSFCACLRALVQGAEESGETIPFPQSLEILMHAVASVQVLDAIKQLLPQTADDGLQELNELLMRTMQHRQRDRHPSSSFDGEPGWSNPQTPVLV